jgi:hypothetical protein
VEGGEGDGFDGVDCGGAVDDDDDDWCRNNNVLTLCITWRLANNDDRIVAEHRWPRIKCDITLKS